MDTPLLQIGAKQDAESVSMLAAAITEILRVAGDARSTEAVQLKALGVLQTGVSVENVRIEGCSLTGEDRRVNVTQ